jgi:hypothetical protein
MIENPPQTPPIPPAVPATKQRHGCLTAFLILMIIANSLVSINYVVNLFISGSSGNTGTWFLLAFIIIGLCSVLCAILLFRWRKIGFWAYCGLGALAIILNLALGAGIISFTSLVSIAVLYGVLQIGKANKGWPQLE